jgi:hypothetical protein
MDAAEVLEVSDAVLVEHYALHGQLRSQFGAFTSCFGRCGCGLPFRRGRSLLLCMAELEIENE